jgi:hypothetical protein
MKIQYKFFIIYVGIFFANIYNRYLLNLNYTDIRNYNITEDCYNNLLQIPGYYFSQS